MKERVLAAMMGFAEEGFLMVKNNPSKTPTEPPEPPTPSKAAEREEQEEENDTSSFLKGTLSALGITLTETGKPDKPY
jgi:hypothetical protein